MAISVIINAENEAEPLSLLLEHLTSQDIYEVIVVDLGSTDRTVAIARQYGATVVKAPKIQDDEAWASGARIASGDIVWFLKAGCSVPDNAADAIMNVLEDNRKSIGGFFRHRSNGSGLCGWVRDFCNNCLKRGYRNTAMGMFLRKWVFVQLDQGQVWEAKGISRCAIRLGRMELLRMGIVVLSN